MNERIRELAEQAGAEPTPFSNVLALVGNDIEKFAELFVRDLIDSMIKRYGEDDELPIQEIKFFAKEHFGVEE